MAEVDPRILRDNYTQLTASTLSASSYENGYEPSKLEDQARGRRWRSATGWTVSPGFNDEFQMVSDAGGLIAHVAPGTYSTGASMATAWQNAANVAGYNPRTLSASGWWRADAVTLDASGLVSAMTDLSGNGRNLSQATSGLRPLWVASAADSRPGLYYNGTLSQGLSSSALMSAMLTAVSGNGTVVVIARLDSDASASDPFWSAIGAGAYAGMFWTGGGNFSADSHDTAQRQAVKAPASGGVSQWHHLWWEWVAATGIIAMADDADDAAWTLTAATGNLHADILGATFNLGATSANGLKGYILEAIIFPSALNEAQRRGLVQYIEGRYPSVAANDTTTAASGLGTFTTAYGSTDKKFAIQNTTGGATVFEIPALTGSPSQDRLAGIYKDLGYTLTDKTGALTYTGTNASYQSRHWIKADLGSAFGLTAGIALDHNAGSSGTFTVEGNSYDFWLSPTLSEALSGDSTQRSDYWASSSQRYWRLTIEDVQNTTGYSELGIWLLGTYLSPGAYAISFEPGYDDLSAVTYATFGAPHLDERPQRNTYKLLWQSVSTTNYNNFVTFRGTTPIGRAFFILLDSAVLTGLKYVELQTPLKTTVSPPSVWDVEMLIREALE
jgi:hypothetical protein